MFVLPDASLAEILLAIEGDATLFPAGFVMRLYTNDLTPTPQSVIGDFTQLTNVEVPGYAAVPITWAGVPIRSGDGVWSDDATDAAFSATGAPPAPKPVFGWYLTDAGNTTLLGSGRLENTFTFTNVGDGFRLEPTLQIVEDTGTTYILTADALQS